MSHLGACHRAAIGSFRSTYYRAIMGHLGVYYRVVIGPFRSTYYKVIIGPFRALV